MCRRTRAPRDPVTTSARPAATPAEVFVARWWRCFSRHSSDRPNDSSNVRGPSITATNRFSTAAQKAAEGHVLRTAAGGTGEAENRSPWNRYRDVTPTPQP